MTLRPGFPIRKSTDQRVLAPPRGLSQRATSFIASQCQGIHQMPLRRLIYCSHRNPRAGETVHCNAALEKTLLGIQRASPVRAEQDPEDSTSVTQTIHNVQQQEPGLIENRFG